MPMTSTGVIVPRLRFLFAKSTPSQTKVDPDKYRAEHGRCPDGYHIDEDTGKCITNEELIRKLQDKSRGLAQKEQPKKPETPKHTPKIREPESDDDEEFNRTFEEVERQSSIFRVLPKGVYQKIRAPFKFLGDRFRKGEHKWSQPLKEEEEKLRQEFHDNPLVNAQSPEDEQKAISNFLGGPGRRWVRTLGKIGGGILSWAASRGPKGVLQDTGKAVTKTLSFMGRRAGDMAEVLGNFVGKHKAMGSMVTKIASGNFHLITAKEKQASIEGLLEGAEIAGAIWLAHNQIQKHVSHLADAAASASEAAHGAVEDQVASSLIEHAQKAAPEELVHESQMAVFGEGLHEAIHEYSGTYKTVAKVRLFDAIAEGVVRGEHKEASFTVRNGEDERKLIVNHFARKVLEELGKRATGYQPSKAAVFRGLQSAVDVAKVASVVRSKKKPEQTDDKNQQEQQNQKELAIGIKTKLEKTSVLVPAGENDWYNFNLMRLIATRFLREISKIMGDNYVGTWMNSAPHGKKQLRNFGDVISEFEADYQKDPSWRKKRYEVAKVIHKYENKHPGINFSFTTKGKSSSLIGHNSTKYEYPSKPEQMFVYHVDPMASLI